MNSAVQDQKRSRLPKFLSLSPPLSANQLLVNLMLGMVFRLNPKSAGLPPFEKESPTGKEIISLWDGSKLGVSMHTLELDI